MPTQCSSPDTLPDLRGCIPVDSVMDQVGTGRWAFICQVEGETTIRTWIPFGKTELYPRAVVGRETNSHRRCSLLFEKGSPNPESVPESVPESIQSQSRISPRVSSESVPESVAAKLIVSTPGTRTPALLWRHSPESHYTKATEHSV